MIGQKIKNKRKRSWMDKSLQKFWVPILSTPNNECGAQNKQTTPKTKQEKLVYQEKNNT